MIKYYKLNDLLNRRGMKKTDLLDIISSPTLAKLSKGETIKTDVIDRICKKLNCQPEDIMEYVPDEEVYNPSEYLPGIKLPVIKKHVKIPLEKPWEEIITEEEIELFWNHYEEFHNAISKEMFTKILYTCAYTGKDNKLRINADNMAILLKEYADMSKVDI